MPWFPDKYSHAADQEHYQRISDRWAHIQCVTEAARQLLATVQENMQAENAELFEMMADSFISEHAWSSDEKVQRKRQIMETALANSYPHNGDSDDAIHGKLIALQIAVEDLWFKR